MPVQPLNRASTAGIPEQWSETFIGVNEGLIVGSEPRMMTEDMTFAANQTVLARTPVGLDASGNLVPAVSGTTQAVALTLRDVVTGAAPVAGVGVLRGGRLNASVVNWPASYDTEEKKLEAFRGAPTPTNFVVVPVVRGATVALP